MIKAIVADEIVMPNTAIVKADKDTTAIDFATKQIAIITTIAIVIAFITAEVIMPFAVEG